MPTISACIITKNEEHNIRDCLESAKWTDEIVVVDDYSTDKTLEIARQYTGKIYRQDWLGYGKQKQFAVDRAAGEWILSIDADERVPSELKDEILNTVNCQLPARRRRGSPKATRRRISGGSTVNGYKIPFRFYFLGHRMRFGGCGREKHLRLFKKAKGKFTEAAIHEGIEVEGEIGKLKNYILHFSYKDKEEYFKKLNEYTSLDAKKRFDLGKRTKWYHTILVPFWEFISKFILKLGFLDGVYGFQWALFSSYYVYIKYLKLRRLFNEKSS